MLTGTPLVRSPAGPITFYPCLHIAVSSLTKTCPLNAGLVLWLTGKTGCAPTSQNCCALVPKHRQNLKHATLNLQFYKSLPGKGEEYQKLLQIAALQWTHPNGTILFSIYETNWIPKGTIIVKLTTVVKQLQSSLHSICSGPFCHFNFSARKMEILRGQAVAQIEPSLIPEHHNREPINTDKADCFEIAVP